MLHRKKLSKEQALQKLRQYCAYQERSHSEVKEKAYSFGLWKNQVEELLSELIQDGYLNEERFAIAFAGGKFRMKQWGRVKIKYALKQKQVSDYCIRKALKEIGEEDYEKTFMLVAEKRWNSIKGAGVNSFVKMSKTREYLLQKGFEAVLINRFINEQSKK
ncbi:MAG: RecX family transcriptional regulator [Terrimonas sp.]|nr:RecX family transcriptional regulator [Terrimonas sp.]